jgi:hypothetical protein
MIQAGAIQAGLGLTAKALESWMLLWVEFRKA